MAIAQVWKGSFEPSISEPVRAEKSLRQSRQR